MVDEVTLEDTILILGRITETVETLTENSSGVIETTTPENSRRIMIPLLEGTGLVLEHLRRLVLGMYITVVPAVHITTPHIQ